MKSLHIRDSVFAIMKSLWSAYSKFQLSTRFENAQTEVQGVVDAVPGLVLWLTPDLRIRDINPAGAKMLHLERAAVSELPFRTINEAIEPELDEWIQRVQQQEGAQMRDAQFTLSGPGWEGPLTLVLRAARIPNTGEWVIVGMDRTDQHRLEIEIDAERQMALFHAKLIGLGEMSGSIMHELSSPLAALTTNAEIAFETLTTAMDSPTPNLRVIRIPIERILANTNRLRSIIQSLRNYSRPITDFERIKRIHVHKLLQELTEMSGWLLGKAGVELRCEPIPESLALEATPISYCRFLS